MEYNWLAMKHWVEAAFHKIPRSNRTYLIGLLIYFVLIVAGCSLKVAVNQTAEPVESPTILSSAVQATSTQTVPVVSTPVPSTTPDSTPSPTSTARPDSNTPVAENNNIFYVSKQGNNADGKTWDTAWNELDQIQWKKIKPGTTIIVKGGEYHSVLNVNASGTAGKPVTITTDGEQVILDGQRLPPPYCGETGYVYQKGENAVSLEGQSYIVIDGKNWRGIVIRNHGRGIMLRTGASNIIVRNVEIYNNGWSKEYGAMIYPDGPGVELGGTDILFERAIIHDNGQDAFQAGWGVWNFTLRNSWLYNSRENPTIPGMPFNECAHTDALQIYDGGLQGPVLIENSILGPSFQQGIMINNKATVNDVIIKNTLFVKDGNGAIAIQNGGASSNWTLQNVTIVQDAVYQSWNVKMVGSNHRIIDSIFWGGPWGIGIFNWSEAKGNYNWLTPDAYNVATEANPMFVDDDYSGFEGPDFAAFNFAVLNPQIPAGTGSTITSVEQLFGSDKQ